MGMIADKLMWKERDPISKGQVDVQKQASNEGKRTASSFFTTIHILYLTL